MYKLVLNNGSFEREYFIDKIFGEADTIFEDESNMINRTYNPNMSDLPKEVEKVGAPIPRKMEFDPSPRTENRTNNFDNTFASDISKIILCISMLLSFFSLFFIFNLIFFKKKNVNYLSEDINILIYLLIVIALSFIFLNYENNFLNILVSISSSVSNIGISFQQIPNNLVFIFLLLVTSCTNIEFTYDQNSEINNPIYNKTKVTLSGKDLTSVYMVIPETLGMSEEIDYELFIDIDETKTRRSVQNNQAVAKMDYKLSFNYELYDIKKTCYVFKKEIISRFTHVPKSSGYNFGSDKSLDSKYKIVLKKSLEDFIDLMSDENNFVCINEG